MSRLDERPAHKSAVAFHNEIASSWSIGYTQGSFNRRLQALKPAISRNVRPGSRWMDLGCGSGALVAELLAGGAEVVGVDGASAMIEHARATFSGNVRTRFIVSDVNCILDCDNQSFDGVLCSSVLEYLAEPQALVLEAHRLLRPDGLLIITGAGALSPVRMLQHVARFFGHAIGRELFSYLEYSCFTQSASGMVKLLADNGFKVERVDSFDPYIPRSLQNILPPAILLVEARSAR